MFSFPSKPKIIEKKGENFAIFEVAELYPGYGTTIGNSLRRVLLSSIPGASITQIKIKGIQHEFSTIPGVLEDVILIILNLKKLRFKLFSDEPQTAILKAKGEKEVKAADFKLPSQVEIVNKDAHIATLTDKKADLEIEARIEKGIGYEPVERRKKEKLPIGFIAIDAIFSPIKRVSYSVENMRVGERTDFDRLKIEIETDGSKNAYVVFVKYTAWKSVKRVHARLIREMEKKFPKHHIEDLSGRWGFYEKICCCCCDSFGCAFCLWSSKGWVHIRRASR